MAGASGGYGVVVSTICKVGAAVQQEVESARNELLPKANQVVISELIDYEYQDQFGAAGVVSSFPCDGDTEQEKHQ
jgi:hypothetical protein